MKPKLKLPRKYTKIVSVKVDDQTKELYRFVSNKGFDAADIFRRGGLDALKLAYLEITDHVFILE